MCDPVTLGVTTAALGVAQGVGGFMNQSAQAKAQTQASVANAEAARRAYEIESGQVSTRQMQEQDQAASKKAAYQREFETMQASAIVRGSEAGVGGLNLSALLGDMATQQDSRNLQLSENTGSVLEQLQNDKMALDGKMQTRVNSVKRGTQPSALGLGLTIAGAALGGYNSYSSALKTQGP